MNRNLILPVTGTLIVYGITILLSVLGVGDLAPFVSTTPATRPIMP